MSDKSEIPLFSNGSWLLSEQGPYLKKFIYCDIVPVNH
jgi:hypothetical protein